MIFMSMLKYSDDYKFLFSPCKLDDTNTPTQNVMLDILDLKTRHVIVRSHCVCVCVEGIICEMCETKNSLQLYLVCPLPYFQVCPFYILPQLYI